MLKITELYENYGVETAPLGDKHYREGWLQCRCPFCGSEHSYHLGYNMVNGYFNCWRCGWHDEFSTILALLSLSRQDTYSLLKQYSTNDSVISLPKYIPVKANTCELPYNCWGIKDKHREYLIRRNFDPDKLIRDWNITGTSEFGDYGNRVIIPITYNGTLCSYQGRDITGESKLRYKACKSADEVINHQHLIYGLDEARVFSRCVIVEGVFDVWRLGYGATCCFGIEYTKQQIFLLTKHFKKVYTLFDNESVAQRQAYKLRCELALRGVDVENIEFDKQWKDPGEMPQEEGDKIMKGLGF